MSCTGPGAGEVACALCKRTENVQVASRFHGSSQEIPLQGSWTGSNTREVGSRTKLEFKEHWLNVDPTVTLGSGLAAWNIACRSWVVVA